MLPRKSLRHSKKQLALLAFFAAVVVFTFFHDRAKQEGPGRFFKGYQGTLVILDMQSGQYERYNPQQAAKRLPPCSTFKIANALIGLETGVVSGPDHLLIWDGQPRPRQADNQNHTLQTAIESSVVWYFQELARGVGSERMAKYLKAFTYGNQDISGGIDKFWLNSSLQISADEQVEFLRKLYSDALPCQPRNMALVREMLVQQKTDQYTFSGKTGAWAGDDGKSSLGWFVGQVARGDKSYVFACNIEAPGANGPQAREIVEKSLQDKGLL